MPKTHSVSRRIFLTLILLFAVILGGVALSMYLTVAASVENAILGNITRDMALAARDFESWLLSKTHTLETLRQAISIFRDDPVKLQALLASLSTADPDIPRIYFGTSQRVGRNSFVAPGVVQAEQGFHVDGSGWTPGKDYDWTTRPWFAQSKSYPDIVIGSPHIDEGTNTNVLSISIACRKDDGSLFGVVGADVRLSRLTTIVAMKRYTPRSRSYLITRDGNFVTGEERLSDMAILPVTNVFAAGSPLAALRDTMNAVDRTSGFITSEGLFYATAKVPMTRWLILAIGPITDVAQPLFKFYQTLILISALAMLAAVLFAVIEAKILSKPIEELKAAAMALANGDLLYRIDIKTKDEFGELADFFNQLAVNLKNDIDRINEQRDEIERYSQTLERKVLDRTKELNEANLLLQIRNDQMEEEVQMAAAVQRKIVPSERDLPVVQGLSFGARYLAMENVGGDLYDVIDLGCSSYALIIGDVSGHGIPAALIAAMAKVSFRAHALRSRLPGEIMTEVNKDLCELIGGETYFVSAFLALLDTADGSLAYTNAGHPPALLRRLAGSVEELDVPNGQLLGIADDFITESASTVMGKGDRLVLFTDGIIEARSPSGQFYDFAKLKQFFAKNGGDHPAFFAEAILDDVDSFCSGARQSDDRAVLVIGIDDIDITQPSSDADDILAETNALLAGGLASEAWPILEELRRKRPEDHRVMNALALVRLKLGDTAGAERLLRTAICMAPDNSEYSDNLLNMLSARDV